MIGLILVFLLLLAAPLIVAVTYCKTKKGHILTIRQSYTKDPRYFGRSFSEMMEAAIPQMKDGVIHLSRDEAVLDADAHPVFPNSPIDAVVIARTHDFCPAEAGLNFQKEIYCEADALFTAENTQLRAVYSKKRVLLGNGCRVLRWVDAEGAVAAFDHCDLGQSLSSGEQLVVGYDNTFCRLYAPVVRLGQRPDEPDLFAQKRDARLFRLPTSGENVLHVRYIGDDLVSGDGIVPYSILTMHDLKLSDGLILQGDIHSDGAVRIMEKAVVLGNIFAERDILLERDSTVLGNVFTQGDIFFEEGACVGQPNKVSSVIARGSIRFSGGNNVYGYIVSEGGGYIQKNENERQEQTGAESLPDYCFPDAIHYPDTVRFRDLEEYRNVDKQGFRLDSCILHVQIPDGADRIPGSQFFACRNLKTVVLPQSITAVEAYAFADCGELTTTPDLKCLPLTFVGTSAFENCEKLYFSGLPDTLRTIEGAAFAGCRSLTKLVFSEDAALETVGDHAFRDCCGLTEVQLPDRTAYVGVSAFLGCTGLKLLSLPETLKDQPGVKELAVNCPDARVLFRKPAQVCTEEVGNEQTV